MEREVVCLICKWYNSHMFNIFNIRRSKVILFIILLLVSMPLYHGAFACEFGGGYICVLVAPFIILFGLSASLIIGKLISTGTLAFVAAIILYLLHTYVLSNVVVELFSIRRSSYKYWILFWIVLLIIYSILPFYLRNIIIFGIR